MFEVKSTPVSPLDSVRRVFPTRLDAKSAHASLLDSASQVFPPKLDAKSTPAPLLDSVSQVLSPKLDAKSMLASLFDSASKAFPPGLDAKSMPVPLIGSESQVLSPKLDAKSTSVSLPDSTCHVLSPNFGDRPKSFPPIDSPRAVPKSNVTRRAESSLLVDSFRAPLAPPPKAKAKSKSLPRIDSSDCRVTKTKVKAKDKSLVTIDSQGCLATNIAAKSKAKAITRSKIKSTDPATSGATAPVLKLKGKVASKARSNTRHRCAPVRNANEAALQLAPTPGCMETFPEPCISSASSSYQIAPCGTADQSFMGSVRVAESQASVRDTTTSNVPPKASKNAKKNPNGTRPIMSEQRRIEKRRARQKKTYYELV